jgi:hypothetical protein
MAKKNKPEQFDGTRTIGFDGDQGVELVDPLSPQIPKPVPEWAKFTEAQQDKQPNAPQDQLKATRYHEDFFYLQPTAAVWYPVAKINIDIGHLGILYHIQQFAVTIDGVNSVYWYTQNDPIFVQKFLPQDEWLSWRLTIDDRRDNEPVAQPVPFGNPPGPVHPRVGSWSDGRYAWDGYNNRFRVLIPEQSVVRLWVGLPPALAEQDRPDWVGGRLVALSQSWKNSRASVVNSRKGW